MTVKLVQDEQTASSSDEDSFETSSSSEEEGEETDSESEAEPVVDSKKVETSPPPVESSKKRSSETDEGGEAKRVKRVSGDDEDKKSVEEEETDSKKVPETMGVETDSPVTDPVVKPPADEAEFVWGDNEIIAAKSVVESVTRFGMDDLVANKCWSRLSSEDKKSFVEEWEALQVNFYSQKTGIIHRVVSKMAEASQPDH